MTLRTFAATLFMVALLSGLPPSHLAAVSQSQAAAARQGQSQTPAPPAAPAPAAAEEYRTDAPQTREALREVLNDYPPALVQVLRLDPNLLSSTTYLAPYPRLATFLARHPEIVRYPSYYIGDSRFSIPDSRRQTIEAIEEVLAGLAVFLFFITAVSMATYVGRSILEHRRWMQATKIQTEAHTKLVDRLTSNEELMAYVQSPAGQRFFSSQPIAIEPDRAWTNVGAPVSRILTSTQIGMVVACGGLGLWIAKNRVIEEVAQLLTVISVLAMALGVGFVLSALLSYGLSKQMGLLKTASHA